MFYAHASRTPYLCALNLCDTLTANEAGTLSASSSATAHSVENIADGRRDRTWWQGATDASGSSYVHTITADCGVGLTGRVTLIALDRGHNLWGRTVAYRSSADGTTWATGFTATLPTLPTDSRIPAGGDPYTGWCITEEGAAYAFVLAPVDARFHQARIVGAAGFIPAVTGLLLGSGVQLSQYMTSVDDDARSRTQSTATSTTGWRAADRTYSWRRLSVKLAGIGAPEYDGALRTQQRLFFDLNQPTFLVVDAGRYPERAGLFVYDGATRDASLTRVYRETGWPFVEHLAALTPPRPVLPVAADVLLTDEITASVDTLALDAPLPTDEITASPSSLSLSLA